MAFLKEMSLAAVTVFGYFLAGFGIEKFGSRPEKEARHLSMEEANDIIRNMPSPEPKQMKPETPPDIV